MSSKLLQSLFHYNDNRLNPHAIKADDFSNETEYLENVKFFSHYDDNGNTVYKDTPPFSFADIEANISVMENEEWKFNRQAEYPSVEDCVHALLDGGDTLTDLQAKRTAVKNKYPKPEW